MKEQFLAFYKWRVPTRNPLTGRMCKWVPKEQGGSVSVFARSLQEAVAMTKDYAPKGSYLAAVDYWPNGRNGTRARLHL